MNQLQILVSCIFRKLFCVLHIQNNEGKNVKIKFFILQLNTESYKYKVILYSF